MGVAGVLELEHPIGAQWRPGHAEPPPLISVPLQQQATPGGCAHGGDIVAEMPLPVRLRRSCGSRIIMTLEMITPS